MCTLSPSRTTTQRDRRAAPALHELHQRARAHLAGRDDALVTVKPMLDRFDAAALAALLKPGAEDEVVFAALRGAETTGRPLGNDDFIKGLERLLGRPIARPAPGRKPAARDADQPTLL